MRKLEEGDTISELKHRHANSVASVQCARVNKLIIYITMHKQKPLIYKLSRRKTPNKANLGLQAYEKNQ